MALRNLKQIYPDIVYICVGYGEEEENIKKLVKELDLEAQVMFFKDISNDLKNALVSKSNIFVMPSIIHKKSVEGFGIAYVEAAQYGIPSIGGKDGGAADAIDHEKTGLICDGNSLDEIYSSIYSMLENKKYLNLYHQLMEYRIVQPQHKLYQNPQLIFYGLLMALQRYLILKLKHFLNHY